MVLLLVARALSHLRRLQYGVSQTKLAVMYYSDDPDVQAEFSSYFGKKRPTPEEYVYMMATKIKY